MRTLRLAAASLLLLIPALASLSEGQLRPAGGELEVGKEYAAQSRVNSTPTGVSFKVPDGCTASIHESTWLVALRFDGSVIGAASMISSMSAAEAEAFLSQPASFGFLDSEVAVEPDGTPSTSGRKTTVSFSGAGCAGFGVVLRGEADNALAAVIAANANESGKAKAALDALEKSVTFTKPSEDARKAWHGKLVGRKMTVSADEVTLEFDLSASGDFSMVYAVGGQSQTFSGKWRIELGVLGGLLVIATEGESRQLRLKQSGNDLYVEGYPAKLSGGNLRKVGDPTPGLKKGGDFKSDIKEVASLDGKDMQFEQPYEGGTQLKVALLGMSFKVPQGCFAAVTAKVNYVLIRPQDQRGLGTIAMQTGTSGIDDLVAMMAGAKDLSSLEQGLVIEPDGEPKVQGGKATLRYTSAQYVCYSVGLVGPSLNAALISFIGPKEDDAKVKGYVEGLANSMQFAKPADADARKQWNEGLKGYCLHYFNYRSAPDHSWTAETNVHIHFGSDNTFYYTYRYDGSMGVRDNPAPGNPIVGRKLSDNSDEAKGTWRLEFTITGALVYLTVESGEVFPLLITVDKQIYVNGNEVSRVKSDKKR